MKKESIYKSFNEWRKANPAAYKSAEQNGFVPKICAEFGWKLPKEVKPSGYWDIKENCYASFKEQDSITGWFKNNPSSYNASKRHGWYDEWVESIRLKPIDREVRFWDEEMIYLDTFNYPNKKSWTKHLVKSFRAAQRLKILDNILTRRLDWVDNLTEITKQHCIEIGEKYDSGNKWYQNMIDRPFYNYAKKNGWLEDCLTHVIIRNKGRGYWTKDLILFKCMDFNNRTDFYEKGEGSYEVAKKLGILDECFAIIDAKKAELKKIEVDKEIEAKRLEKEKKIEAKRLEKEKKIETKRLEKEKRENIRKNMIMDNENIILAFKEIHGDKYDYSLVNYVDKKTKVKINCNKHGEFEQLVAKHVRGQGCHGCYLDMSNGGFFKK